MGPAQEVPQGVAQPNLAKDESLPVYCTLISTPGADLFPFSLDPPSGSVLLHIMQEFYTRKPSSKPGNKDTRDNDEDLLR